MRKLSKKISMLMVLAMLVGLFSGVVSASAASAWSFASGKYAVAVNGSINMESKEYADFDLLKDGKAPAGYTVAWASSDEDVVWVNAKTGQLRANKFGKAADGDKAVISATFTNTATKKSATRSFTIVLGAAKADFTVEAADVTIALGEEVKFAPVVKDAAGNVVKFATHKSYNGYFLDGKAIANPWTPEEAGEYTVTVAQFAKKADVADLAKAVRKDEVKVTVTVDAEFDAKATGLKEITAYGEFAKDATFTIKKGSQNVAFTATVAEDGKTAKLALNSRITKGTYTVACGDAKVDLALEDEKVETITIFEKGGQIFTGKNATEAYVHYDVFNQYGESVRKTFDVEFTSSEKSAEVTDRNNGIITITANTKFDYADTVVLTGVASGYGYAKSETATMTIGLEHNASTVKIVGVTLEDSGVLLQEVPARFQGGSYYLVFEMYDRAGYVMDFDPMKAGSDLTFTSLNPLLVSDIWDGLVNLGDTDGDGEDNFGTYVQTKYIDGTAYGAVLLTPGLASQVKKGGVAEVRVTSTKTGQNTSYLLKVASEQILDEFRIVQPDYVIATNDPWNNATKAEIGYEAIDTEGNKITDFRALYQAVSFSDDAVRLEEQNDGSAKLFLYVGNTSANPKKDYDYPVVFTAIVPGTGKSDNATINVKYARNANSVTGFVAQDFSEYILEGNSIRLNMIGNSYNGAAGRIEFADQYDVKVENGGLFSTGKGKYVAAKVVDGSGAISISGSTAAATNSDYQLFNVSDITLTAAQEATDSIKSVVIEFAVADTDGKILSGSDKRITFYVADINKCASFTVAADNNLIKNQSASTWFKTTANLVNGKKVAVANSVDNAAYYIEYKAKTDAYVTESTKDKPAEQVVSGTTVTVVPVLDKTGTQFKDQSAMNADGSRPDRILGYDITANIYVKNGASYTIKESTKCTLDVANYDVKVTTINMQQWNNLPWINFNTDAYVNATNGEISYIDLIKYVDTIKDNYEDTAYENCGNSNGAWAAADWFEGVRITISKLVEGEKGLDVNDLELTNNTAALVHQNCWTEPKWNEAEDVVLISNAEIGDTFVATYTIGDAKHSVNFVVGADTTAWFSDSNDPCPYR